MESLASQVKRALAEMSRTGELHRILLIDKDPQSRLASQLALDGRHRVHCASVQEAWHLIYPHPPQAIVLHLYDTGAAALADFHECRALAGGAPIVLALSGAPTRDLIESARHGTVLVLAAGADGAAPARDAEIAAPLGHS